MIKQELKPRNSLSPENIFLIAMLCAMLLPSKASWTLLLYETGGGVGVFRFSLADGTSLEVTTIKNFSIQCSFLQWKTSIALLRNWGFWKMEVKWDQVKEENHKPKQMQKNKNKSKTKQKKGRAKVVWKKWRAEYRACLGSWEIGYKHKGAGRIGREDRDEPGRWKSTDYVLVNEWERNG